jgi:hypothetical protein
MSDVTWTKHQSGILFRRRRKDGSPSISSLLVAVTDNFPDKLLYQIKGEDGWIDEQDFCRHYDVNTRYDLDRIRRHFRRL